jgi:hypothetical protein
MLQMVQLRATWSRHLDQRHRYENAVKKTHNGNVLQCDFNEPIEGNIGGFSYLDSLKNVKGDSVGVPFSKIV